MESLQQLQPGQLLLLVSADIVRGAGGRAVGYFPEGQREGRGVPYGVGLRVRQNDGRDRIVEQGGEWVSNSFGFGRIYIRHCYCLSTG